MTARFHIPRPVGETEAAVVLSRDESRHLARVLRLRQGEEARLFDSTGAEFRVVIETASARASEARIVERLGRAQPVLRRLTLAVSLIRNEPMRWLVQKATELGVERLTPFVSERTAIAQGEEGESDSARRRRWERVSLAACKQSGRSHPIDVSETVSFSSLVGDLAAAALAILAWEGGGAGPLGEVLAQRLDRMAENEPIVLAIGPEGGFTEEEFSLACRRGFVPAGLGPYVLRTETAALSAAAMILGWPRGEARTGDPGSLMFEGR